MSEILNELMKICLEFRSEKVTTRYKAAERFDQMLLTSRKELVLQIKSHSNTGDLSWNNLFNNVIDAVFKHASKLEDIKDAKSVQTMRNKNYLFSGIINKIVDLNLEDKNFFLTKSVIFNAFTEGLKVRVTIKHFGLLFLNILERGLYKSEIYIREIKVNEFSRILSHLFEVNVDNDEILRFAILKSIIRTIELAYDYVQLNADVIEYLPEVAVFANKANNIRHKEDVIRLFHLFVSQLTVDYHYTISVELQNLVPLICGFYDLSMKAELKEILFHSMYLSVYAIYPQLDEGNFSTMNVPLDNNWSTSIKKLKNLVDAEINERTKVLSRVKNHANDKSFQVFVEMSAAITYIFYWQIDSANNRSMDEMEPRTKISKPADTLETVINTILPSTAKVHEIWLAIIAKIIKCYNVLTVSNIKTVLQLVLDVFNSTLNTMNMIQIKHILQRILEFEKNLLLSANINSDYCKTIWSHLISNLLADSTTISEFMVEKHIIFQLLISYNKLETSDCLILLQTLISNNASKRTECLQTAREILINSNTLDIDKIGGEIGRLIKWVYEINDKLNVQNVLQNIAPIDFELIADTCAIGVINFLGKNQPTSICVAEKRKNSNHFKLLLFKYNKKLICLEEHAKCEDYCHSNCINYDEISHVNGIKMNCLFQTNYELLMRLASYETTKATTFNDILIDLHSLHKIVCVMKALIDYNVFDEHNFSQCPLIKRIGLYLSHLELQLKSNSPRSISTHIAEILVVLAKIFEKFAGNEILLNYMEKQPLDELINFVGGVLTFSSTQQFDTDFDSSNNVPAMCLKLLTILCASETHFLEAFTQLKQYSFKVTRDIQIIFDLIQIFCDQKRIHVDIANWFVDKLKAVFKLYYTDIKIVEQIISLIPAIFKYVYCFEDSLQNMLIALVSLLKIANKKSYSIYLTVKLIKSVRSIALKCRHIYKNENFKNVCISVAKFLAFPSLEIQFAAINTITALMDGKLIFKNSHTDDEIHFNFCDEVYSHIDWKNLSSNEFNGLLDVKQNSIVVAVQILTALFAFSSYHQNTALQDLTYLCALRKLKESDLYAFNEVSLYYKCSNSDLTKPFVERLIHTWTAKKYPILKFPYYLCCDTKDNFISNNLSTIIACLLMYSDVDEIKKLVKYGSLEDLIKAALPLVFAFYLPYASSIEEDLNEDYKKHMQVLIKNLKTFRIDLNNPKKNNWDIKWETLFQILKSFEDNNHYKNMIKLQMLTSKSSDWFVINYSTLEMSLRYYVNAVCDGKSTKGVLTSILTKQSIVLVRCLNEIKKMISLCIFSFDKLKYFYKFCTLADIIIVSFPNNSHNGATSENNSAMFFMRDALFFVLNYLQTAHEYPLQHASLKFLERLLQQSVVLEGCCLTVIKTYLNDICKALVNTINKTSYSDIKEVGINLLNKLIIEQKDKFVDVTQFVDEFPRTEIFKSLYEYQLALQSVETSNKSTSCIKSFLHNKNRTFEGLQALRQNLSTNKGQLQENESMLLELINRLIDIVRTVDSKEIKTEAAKCLGEIGALKINQTSYYFPIENQKDKVDKIEPISEFINCILNTIDKRLIFSKADAQDSLVEVLIYCINSEYGPRYLETYPHLSVFCQKLSCINYLDTYASIEKIEWIDCLKSSFSDSYEQWIQIFMSNVFRQCEWTALQKLALCDFCFAEATLLPFVELLLTVNKNRHLTNLCALLEYFFEEFIINLNSNSEERVSEMKLIFKEKRIINKFLNICECVRVNNEWNIPINYLNVSKACNYCQAYFMSIMYLELWASSELTNDTSKLSTEIIANSNFQECSTKAYQAIGCNDAISGFLNPLNSRLELLELENDWTDALLEAESTTAQEDLYLPVLKRNGLLSLASLQNKNKNVDYEICWRLGQWDTVVEGFTKVNSLNDMENEYSKHHFNALKSLFNREENNTLAALNNARDCVLFILKEISVECLQSIYKYLTWLHFLQHVEEFCKVQFNTGIDLSQIFQKWQKELDSEYGSFYFKEQVISHQIAIYKTAGIRANRKIKEILNENPIEVCLIKCIQECKKTGELNLAKRNIAVLRNMKTDSEQNKLIALLEDADVCFKTNKPQITKAILQYILTTTDFLYCLERISALQMYGQYMMETNNEPFVVVSEKYFLKSVDLFSKMKEKIRQKYQNRYSKETEINLEVNNKKDAYNLIAKYADREYTQLNSYINSPEFQIKCRIIKENREAANSIGKQQKDRDKLVGASNLKKFANLDEMEVQNVELRRTDNLCISIENYIRYCTLDEDKSSSSIYRIIALWFANKQNEILHSKIVENIYTIPSYKFICALNQMTARLNSKSFDFLIVIKKLLIRCAQEHPQHTLYQLYPLVFAYADTTSIDNRNDNRTNIAKEIIIEARNKMNTNCFKQMESMFAALIDFANTSPPENKKSSIALSEKLKRLKLLDAVQCPTIHLPVSPNLVYHITSIIKWNDNVSMVGGINAPKKITCICSDGISRPQLLKGKDDLRQDAVMQQVFVMINELLKKDQKAIERNLMLRTYKVTPLSMRSGILEWCQNTIPIGIYLTGDGKGGAHKKYHPNDYTNFKCRQLSLAHLKSDINKRYQTYIHICDNIKPVLHYFLLEKFKVPGVWFERRLGYINSVATTSIVGYILGLGDRHTQNILIDEKTAELVHIDFGIAFEQGRVMPTPEMVPFRLTRDIVSPMGICGTNGVFKKSCEVTMEILRLNQSVITTILEVLLYDPLYIWRAVTPTNTEFEKSDEKNLTAQRALLVVKDKLEGKQPGFLGTASVDVHVQRLINDAISARNLCQLYPGWDPYL